MKYSNLSAEQKESMTLKLREMFEKYYKNVNKHYLCTCEDQCLPRKETYSKILGFQLAQKKEIEFLESFCLEKETKIKEMQNDIFLIFNKINERILKLKFESEVEI